MEHFAFIVTAWACAIVAFCTWCDSKKHEEETRVEERIVRAIQTYVDKSIQHFKQEIVRDHLKKQEHLAQCLLFRTVHVAEVIQGISVEGHDMITTGQLSFFDVHVFDWNGDQVLFKTVDKEKNQPQNKYLVHYPTKMNIEFEGSVGFQYIEFIDVNISLNLMKHTRNKAIVNFLNSDKTIICTTTISMKKNKIYNTAFLCTF